MFTGNCSGRAPCKFTDSDSMPYDEKYAKFTVKQLQFIPVCDCALGWALPDCAKCTTGFFGEDCESFNCSHFNDCSNHGECAIEGREVVCKCDPGFVGEECDIVYCQGTPACNGNGYCDLTRVEDFKQEFPTVFANFTAGLPIPNFAQVPSPRCLCDAGWEGITCNNFRCPGDCNGNGACTGPSMCECTGGWAGVDCSQAVCAGVGHCSMHGVCVGPNLCECEHGYTGSDCSSPVATRDVIVIIGTLGAIGVVCCLACGGAYYYAQRTNHRSKGYRATGFFDPIRPSKSSGTLNSWVGV